MEKTCIVSQYAALPQLYASSRQRPVMPAIGRPRRRLRGPPHRVSADPSWRTVRRRALEACQCASMRTCRSRRSSPTSARSCVDHAAQALPLSFDPTAHRAALPCARITGTSIAATASTAPSSTITPPVIVTNTTMDQPRKLKESASPQRLDPRRLANTVRVAGEIVREALRKSNCDPVSFEHELKRISDERLPS